MRAKELLDQHHSEGLPAWQPEPNAASYSIPWVKQMDEIQRLKRGTPIELIGGCAAVVEQNPKDGVWLLARVPSSVSNGEGSATSRLREAFDHSIHGVVSFRDAESQDLLLYVHADDIVGAGAPFM